MSVKLLTEQHLDFLSLKGGCRGSSESTHVKMPHCWKSHALAQLLYPNIVIVEFIEIKVGMQIPLLVITGGIYRMAFFHHFGTMIHTPGI